MLEDSIKELLQGYPRSAGVSQRDSPGSVAWSVSFLLCALGLVVCVLLTVTPLIRIPDSVISLHLTPGSFLANASGWLPSTLGPANQLSTAYLEFFSLIILAFLCYGLGALLVGRQAWAISQKKIRCTIWLGTILAGVIYTTTPAMLSHDILVYASFGRVLGTYHANPYFVPISTFPQDPFTALNYWAAAISAYGPIWTLICGFFGWLLSPNLVAYVVAFRLFALAAQLLNIWLVERILQAMGRSPRIITLGMLLYAWNPLLLLESGLGGHNDGFMITFVLTGILLAVSAEARKQLLHARGYLPAVIALTLAVLVKFTALPILAMYLLFLIYTLLRSTVDSPRELRRALRNWRPAVFALLWSCLVGALIMLIFYGPFWFGHDLPAIMASFKNPPSALYSENSFMRSAVDWLTHHSAQQQNSLLLRLSRRNFWDELNFTAIILCLLVGAVLFWFKPTTRTFVVIALATMCVILIITPWFYSWYITWILGLAVICLPTRRSRVETALLALTCTFSFSALLTYLFDAGLFGSNYYLVSLFTTIPPACTFLLALVLSYFLPCFKNDPEKAQNVF
jgi:hypothetical protein